MKIVTLLAIAILVTAVSGFAPFEANMSDTKDVNGKWVLTVDVPGEPVEVLLELKQEGEIVTGTMSSAHGNGKVTKGTYKDNKLSATLAADIQGSPAELQVDASVDGEKISGSLTAGGLGTFSFAGARSK